MVFGRRATVDSRPPKIVRTRTRAAQNAPLHPSRRESHPGAELKVPGPGTLRSIRFKHGLHGPGRQEDLALVGVGKHGGKRVAGESGNQAAVRVDPIDYLDKYPVDDARKNFGPLLARVHQSLRHGRKPRDIHEHGRRGQLAPLIAILEISRDKVRN